MLHHHLRSLSTLAPRRLPPPPAPQILPPPALPPAPRQARPPTWRMPPRRAVLARDDGEPVAPRRPGPSSRGREWRGSELPPAYRIITRNALAARRGARYCGEWYSVSRLLVNGSEWRPRDELRTAAQSPRRIPAPVGKRPAGRRVPAPHRRIRRNRLAKPLRTPVGKEPARRRLPARCRRAKTGHAKTAMSAEAAAARPVAPASQIEIVASIPLTLSGQAFAIKIASRRAGALSAIFVVISRVDALWLYALCSAQRDQGWGRNWSGV